MDVMKNSRMDLTGFVPFDDLSIRHICVYFMTSA